MVDLEGRTLDVVFGFLWRPASRIPFLGGLERENHRYRCPFPNLLTYTCLVWQISHNTKTVPLEFWKHYGSKLGVGCFWACPGDLCWCCVKVPSGNERIFVIFFDFCFFLRFANSSATCLRQGMQRLMCGVGPRCVQKFLILRVFKKVFRGQGRSPTQPP